MQKLSVTDVEYVAGLAHLALDDAARQRLVGELGKILEYMDALNRVDTRGVEPMMHAMAMTNVFREDVVSPWLTREEALRNAPSHDASYFLVPKILETGEGG
jgi:aspartyl-tRNA(Asn)/glutamyl-tRNA(Gln) amidotransferase subunit C